jgi:chemotaxis protein histidine kinase CheA
MKPAAAIPYLLILLCLSLLPDRAAGQNIVGLKILIGADAPAFIAFPSEVDNARWDNSEMNDFYKFTTRNENTMQISYNGKGDPPVAGTGFSVIQGKNTHYFTLVFKKDYDINKDPVLYYDFSDKGKLKSAAEKVKNAPPAAEKKEPEPEVVINEKEERTKQEDLRREEEKRKKEMALAQQQKKKEIEQQQKAESEKEKQEEKLREAEIAKTKKEAQLKEAEQKKAKEKEETLAREKAETERKNAAALAQEKARQDEENRKLALAAAQEKDKAAREKLEQQQKERAEAERKKQAELAEKERIRKEKEAAKAELARQEAETRRIAMEEAQARLLALQKEKEEARKNAAYSLSGLWNRYGKKGINLYEIPLEQNSYNNTDFYVAGDTLANYQNSSVFLSEAPRLNIASETQRGVTLTLTGISFKGPIAYYRLLISNNSEEDYLVGANNLAWYNPDGSPKVFLKCSYLTHIGFFPLVKPGEARNYVYATRAANINDNDKLVFTVQERRQDQPKLTLFFDGAVYNQELSLIEKRIGSPAKDETKSTKEEKKEHKRDRKNKKNKD